MSNINQKPLFRLGRIVSTLGAAIAMRDAGVSTFRLLHRHQRGDWGELDAEDCAANDRAVVEGTRILSAYRVGEEGTKLWVITEWDRSLTTLLLAEDY